MPATLIVWRANTTLYALPKAEIVDRWYAQTTDDFRFWL
ncbi:Uncharacterised protein [Salmonella bongori]|nr:Uncharacterised protein [Salmonella bongori]